MLMIYDSSVRKKVAFTPMTPGQVSLYVCGNTVYDHCHLGHARAMICFDVIVRYLRASGLQVTYVRNITDIDDKIIQRAQARGIHIDALTDELIAAMNEDAALLSILPPTHEPRATAYIEPMIQLIERLIDREHAYVSAGGDVCFAVHSFAKYGQLSHQNLEELQSGVRIEVDQDKRCALDFVLWKLAKPGEPSWPSPWGEGRPGWHIECSAMAMELLGEQFDLHGGGLDLQFPHHENEIAQSECASGKTFANYWLHAGLLQINHEKMSKSTGNFLTIQDVVKRHAPEVVRYFLLSSHYRSPLNYTDDQVLRAQNALSRLYQALKNSSRDTEALDAVWVERFNAAMNDDFNTPVALSVLFELSHAVNKSASSGLAATLRHLGGVLGLLQQDSDAFLKSLSMHQDPQRIEAMILERTQARVAKDWQRADEIRKTLLDEGIELEDGPSGTTWRGGIN